MGSLSSLISNAAIKYPRSGIRRMTELAAKYNDVITLCLGEPNFDTPQNIIQAAKQAMDEGCTHYTPNPGLPELREAIVDKYSKEYDLNYDLDNVMVTLGGMEALVLSFLTILNPGDQVIVPNPTYDNYLGQIIMLGGEPVPVPVYEENQFKIQASDIEKAITDKTKAILINSPSNPLGAVLEKEDLEAIAKVAIKHNLIVISDEVYEKILYDGRKHICTAQIPGMKERTIVVNSFSKTYAMTGWRIGFLVGPKEIVSNMPKMQEGLASCVSGFVQKAAVEALRGPQDAVTQMVNDYTRRRSIIYEGLNKIPGFVCQKPAGSFYAFPNIKAFGKTSVEFAEELLSEAHVATVPASAFGSMGEGYLRISFANSDENLHEAVERIANYIKKAY